MTPTLQLFLIISSALFSIGLLAALSRRHAIFILIGIEPLTVKRIGEMLMTNYVWPLQCVGLLLTAALIGALVLVMEEKR